MPCPPPGDLFNPGIKSRCPTLQADSLPSKPPGKPKNTGVGSLSLLQGLFPTQESNQGLLHCRWFLTSGATRAALPYGIIQLNTSGEGCIKTFGDDYRMMVMTTIIIVSMTFRPLAMCQTVSYLTPMSSHLYVLAQLHVTLCDPTDCSPPGSSVHGILQARRLEWVAISSSRGSSQPRDQTHISCFGRWILYHCTTSHPVLTKTL